MSLQIAQQLKSAIVGLTFMSETDEPIEFVSLGKGPINIDRVLEYGGHDRQSSCQELTLDAVFKSQPKDNLGILNLRKLLEKSMTGVRVFRIGETNPTYYILGNASGESIGVRANAVETG